MDNSDAASPMDTSLRKAEILRQMMEKTSRLNSLKINIQDKNLKDLASGDPSITPQPPPSLDDRSPNAIIYVLNELLMEYFHWFGYRLSLAMFSIESGFNSSCPNRELLERRVGEYDKDMPILVLEVLRLLHRNKAQKN